MRRLANHVRFAIENPDHCRAGREPIQAFLQHIHRSRSESHFLMSACNELVNLY